MSPHSELSTGWAGLGSLPYSLGRKYGMSVAVPANGWADTPGSFSSHLLSSLGLIAGQSSCRYAFGNWFSPPGGENDTPMGELQ